MDKNIGFIGLGVMGNPMCSHLIGKAENVYIYTRTRNKAENLLCDKVFWCGTPSEVAEKSDIVFTIVGYPEDVDEVYLGENGLIHKAHEGQIFIDMTTTTPTLEIQISKALSQKGAGFIDAPVSGGDVGARNASLSIMAGGSSGDLERVMPYLKLLGTNIVHTGGVGSGQHTKMANQIVISGTMIGVSEALLYAEKAGLDLEKTISTISKGAAGCWTLDNLAPRVVKSNFNPGFMIDHFIKDMKIALEESKAMGLSLPGLTLVEKLYEKASGLGYGRNGTQALILAIKELSKEA